MQNFRNNVSFYNNQGTMPCHKADPLSDMPLAMAYVPWQRWQNLFDADRGFHCGTIFQELHKPFEHAGGGCR